MAALVNDLIDRWRRLASDRILWESHWEEICRYVLPAAERFDMMFATGSRSQAIDSVVSEPIGSRRAREIYDTTSLQAIDRGAAGTLSLITPQTGTWHDLGSSDPFAEDPTDEERKWLEKVRNYLFRVRGNPMSGFWDAHKASLRCVWAFGTSVMFIRDAIERGTTVPIGYAYVPISENHLSCNFEGRVNENFRVFTRSAKQCVEKWGGKVSPKIKKMAENPQDKDRRVTLLHAVYPRDEHGSYGNTNRNAPWASCYVDVDERYLIAESGFWEFPYRVDHWQRQNPNEPYAEGPVSIALADIKSLNMLSKTELRAAQQGTDPPLATFEEGQNRPNLNPRAINPGYINARGQLLIQPILTARPDFAQAVLETRRTSLRSSLYIDLWTAILQSQREMTAFEVMVKNQEKGDLLGPVGSSLQGGLSTQVDREIGILGRRRAFDAGSPLEAPDSMIDRDVAARFTSPLDRIRRMGELQGATQLWELARALGVTDRLDADETIDLAQELLGAPAAIMVDDDVLAARRAAAAEAANAERTLVMAEAAGNAGKAAAEGSEAIAQSPAARAIIEQMAGVAA